MRIAVISDIHGNLVALEKCWAAIESLNCEKVICLGDVVGYFPDGIDCLEYLEKKAVPCLLGNHEAMLIGKLPIPEEKDEVYKLSEIRDAVPKDLVAAMHSRLPYTTYNLANKDMLFVHGSPWDPLQGYYYINDDFDDLAGLDFALIFMGHTHRPFIRKHNNMIFVNVGSCGLPRDDGALPSFAIYDSESHATRIVRVSIDVNEVQLRYPYVHKKVKDCLNRKENRQTAGERNSD